MKSDVKMTAFCMRTTRDGRPGQTVHFGHFRTGYSGRQYFFFGFSTIKLVLNR